MDKKVVAKNYRFLAIMLGRSEERRVGKECAA